MSSEPRTLGSLRPLARRGLPWVAWGLAAVTALAMSLSGRGLGSAPAAAEARTASLSSPRPLKVVSVEVKEGELVTEGQVLARLDPTRADAELAAARAKLERLKLAVAAKEAALGDDRLKVSSREAAHSERVSLELAELETDAKRDRAELTQLDAQLARQTQLVDEKLASADALNELALKRAALADRAQAWDARLQRAREARAAALGRAGQWQGPRNTSDARIEQQLAPMRVAVAAQEGECRKLEALRASLELTAPFAGRVSAIGARVMETVRVGRGVVTVVDEHPSTAVAYVDQSWAGQVRVGDDVRLTPVDHSGPTRRGKVTSLGPAIAETPKRFQPLPGKVAYSREARVELEPGAPPMVAGQAFTAGFHRGADAPATRLLGAR